MTVTTISPSRSRSSPRRGSAPTAPVPAPRREPPRPPVPAPTPRSAVGLLRQAADGIAEAHREPDPITRYPLAYLAALRAAAAVLAVRATPQPRRGSTRNAWQLLAVVEHQLVDVFEPPAGASAARLGPDRRWTVAQELRLRSGELLSAFAASPGGVGAVTSPRLGSPTA